VPQLVARGHQVTATTTNAGKLDLLERLGADGVVMDGLDPASVGEAVAAARPDAIVNQMTALSVAHAGKPNLRKADRFFATTNGLRSEGTDHLLAAAEATGVSHVVAQGHASMNGIREGGWVKTEEDPLEVLEGTKAINHLEDVVVRAGGAVLRYGGFYGPGATDDQVELVRKRLFPLVGDGTGYFSWVHVDDAALPSWRWSRRQRACSTSSMTSRPRSASGCRISRSAPEPNRPGGSPRGWPGCWPARWWWA
jgi:nucleoside-diphosphate-sugar epimerase